jgi:predicted GIY-YIG superfamily endonuclease
MARCAHAKHPGGVTQMCVYVDTRARFAAGVLHSVQNGIGSQFVKRYAVTRLVYFETGTSAKDAIAREKQIKGWVRSKKVALVATTNPTWRDLTPDFT